MWLYGLFDAEFLVRTLTLTYMAVYGRLYQIPVVIARHLYPDDVLIYYHSLGAVPFRQ